MVRKDHKIGGWTGSVIGFNGNEKQRQLFKTGSRIDFYEEDIVSMSVLSD